MEDVKELMFNTTLEDLLTFIKGPDFPTAGLIYGAADIKEMYATGRKSIMMRARVTDEDMGKGKMAIIVNELPYQVNKALLVEKIANLVNDKKIVGISDLRDESDRDGIRVVIELKKMPHTKSIKQSFKFTNLQTSFPVNIVALVDGVPQTLSLKTILEIYIRNRVEVIVKRSEYELKEAKARAHILEGYLIALDHIDEVIAVIKKSKDEPEAKEKLMKKFGLSLLQAQAIMEMQLRRLTGLERNKIEDELALLKETISYLESLLKDIFKILVVIKNEILYLKTKYGDERRTQVMKFKPGEITDEQLIENKEVIVVLTKEGYIKQIPRETFRLQHRGGKGVSGMETKDTDNVYYITTAMTHDYMLFFSNQGRVFQTRVWDVPVGSRISKGKAIINLVALKPEEKITSILSYSVETMDKAKNMFVVMSTKYGTVKKSSFEDYINIRTNGIIAIRLEKNDELLWVKLTDGTKNVILASKNGKAIVFKEKEIRSTGRASIGVKGMDIEPSVDHEVIAADVFSDAEFKKDILVLTERGIGKKLNFLILRGNIGVVKGSRSRQLIKK